MSIGKNRRSLCECDLQMVLLLVSFAASVAFY